MNRLSIISMIFLVGLSFTAFATIVPLLNVGGFGLTDSLSFSATSVDYGPRIGLDLADDTSLFGLSTVLYVPLKSFITQNSTVINLQERLGLKKFFFGGDGLLFSIMVGGSAKQQDILSSNRSWEFGLGGEIGISFGISDEVGVSINVGGDYFLDNIYDLTADTGILFIFE